MSDKDSSYSIDTLGTIPAGSYLAIIEPTGGSPAWVNKRVALPINANGWILVAAAAGDGSVGFNASGDPDINRQDGELVFGVDGAGNPYLRGFGPDNFVARIGFDSDDGSFVIYGDDGITTIFRSYGGSQIRSYVSFYLYSGEVVSIYLNPDGSASFANELAEIDTDGNAKFSSLTDHFDVSSISPDLRRLYTTDGTTVILDYSGASIIVNGTDFSIAIDGTTQIGGGLIVLYADGSALFANGSVIVDVSGNISGNSLTTIGSLGVFNTIPPIQGTTPTAVSALTDSTGGTVGTELVTCVGGLDLVDASILDSNVASLNAKIDLLRAQVDALSAIISSFGFCD